MSLYFVGNEWDAYTLASGSFVTDTSGTFHNSIYTRMAMEVKETATITGDFNAASTEGWFHCVMGMKIVDNFIDNRYLELRDSNRNSIVIRILATNTVPSIQRNVGGSQVNIGSSPMTINTKFVWDIHWVLSTDPDKGLLEWFVDGSLRHRVAGSFLSTSSFNMIDSVRIYSPRGNTSNNRHAFWSEVVAADEPTIGWHVATITASSEGASTTWSGTTSDINGAGIADGTFIDSTAANQVELNVCTDLSGSRPSGQTRVVGLAVAARHGQSSTTGPDQLQVALRTGSSNHFSSNLIEPGSPSTSAYNGCMRVWDTNPIGSSVWTIADIDALEIGAKSIT